MQVEKEVKTTVTGDTKVGYFKAAISDGKLELVCFATKDGSNDKFLEDLKEFITKIEQDLV